MGVKFDIGKAKASRPREGFIPNPERKLLEQIREVMRFKHSSVRRSWLIRGGFVRRKRKEDLKLFTSFCFVGQLLANLAGYRFSLQPISVTHKRFAHCGPITAKKLVRRHGGGHLVFRGHLDIESVESVL